MTAALELWISQDERPDDEDWQSILAVPGGLPQSEKVSLTGMSLLALIQGLIGLFGGIVLTTSYGFQGAISPRENVDEQSSAVQTLSQNLNIRELMAIDRQVIVGGPKDGESDRPAPLPPGNLRVD